MGHESSKIMQASFVFGSVMCTTYARGMSKVAMIALKIEIDRAKNLFASLTPDQWSAQSGCTDWRVQDVACHMASVFHQIADPATIDGGNGEDAEVDAEVPVQARKNWTPLQVMAEYNEWAEKGFAALGAMQEEPTASTVIAMANLGSHPLHIASNAIVFDHYCHLRHDIGHAIPAAADLPRDDAALSAALVWMMPEPPKCVPLHLRRARWVSTSFLKAQRLALMPSPRLQPAPPCGVWCPRPTPPLLLPPAPPTTLFPGPPSARIGATT